MVKPKKEKNPLAPNSSKVWIALISLVLGLILLITLGGYLPPLFAPLSSVLTLVVALPVLLLQKIFPAINDPAAMNYITMFLIFLYSFVVGLVVCLLLYKRYGKALWWSILFTLGAFLVSLFASLVSDATGSLAFEIISRILFTASAPLGYFLGMYLGVKIKKK